MKRIKFSLLTIAAAIPVAGFMLAGAASPNLIANGAFTNNVAGWDDFSGSPSWDKGTMTIFNNYQGTGNSYYSGWYCVKNLQPGTEYQASSDYYVKANAPANTGADLSVHYYASNDCSGTNLVTGGGGQSGGRLPEQRAQWLTFSFKSEAPATAHSARVRATAFKEPKAPAITIPGVHSVSFDNVYFGEATKQIIVPNPTSTPAGPKDIIANPEPTATPKGPQDILANPQPTATPQTPEAGDPGNADIPAGPKDQPALADPTIDTGGASGPSTGGSSAADSGRDPLPPSTGQGEDDGAGLGLMLIAFGSAIAAIGLAIGTLARRRRHDES